MVFDSISSSEEWIEVNESSDPPTIKFSVPHATTGPQIPRDVKEPMDYFRLYFTDELVENIIKETNKYAVEKIKKKELSSKSLWHMWRDVTKEEFFAFIAVVLNMGLIQVQPNGVCAYIRLLIQKQDIYFRSNDLFRPDLPVNTRIPLHLYKKLLERIPDAKGYHMYTDIYYTSIFLAEELLKMNL